MRFIPAHKQTNGDTAPLEAAKLTVELVLISNTSSMEQFVNMDRIHQVLAPALCTACQMTPEQVNFFPARQPRRGGPTNPPPTRRCDPYPYARHSYSHTPP